MAQATDSRNISRFNNLSREQFADVLGRPTNAIQRPQQTTLSPPRALDGISATVGSIPAIDSPDVRPNDSNGEAVRDSAVAQTARLSRRSFFMNSIVSTASLATATAIAPVSNETALGGDSEDAALLALGRRLQEAWAEQRLLEPQGAFEAAFDRTGAIASEIEALPATTLDGLRVKALAFWWCHSGEQPIVLDDQQTTDIRLCQSIIGDLLTAFGYRGDTFPPAASEVIGETLKIKADDLIFAAIEAHRVANAEYEKACEAPGRMVEKSDPVRVCVGQARDTEVTRSITADDGSFTITWKPTGKYEPAYAYDLADIERSVPKNLDGAARQAWIDERFAALTKEEERIARLRARTKLGKLEAIREKAWEHERERMWELIWTVPTTAAGLAALLQYCRENESINELVHRDEWEDVLEWTIECAVCALAGLPKPPMSDLVAAVLKEEAEEEEEDQAA